MTMLQLITTTDALLAHTGEILKEFETGIKIETIKKLPPKKKAKLSAIRASVVNHSLPASSDRKVWPWVSDSTP